MLYLVRLDGPPILPVMRYLLSQCPMQERGHLASDYAKKWVIWPR